MKLQILATAAILLALTIAALCGNPLDRQITACDQRGHVPHVQAFGTTFSVSCR